MDETVNPRLETEDEMARRWADSLKSAEDPSGASSPCCRFLDPEARVCRHLGKDEGALGCIAYMLGRVVRDVNLVR
jgi:hypothetical protein